MFKERLNKIEDRIIKISGQDYIPVPFTLEWVLVGLSHLYGIGVGLWLRLYQNNILHQKKLPCFVVSIGNIVAGGTGKTPVTVYVAALLKKIGKAPVVISRGYKGNYEDAVLVSDGQRVFSSAEESGDEPFMMASRLLFPVVVGKDRFRAGMKALYSLRPRPDVMVLDDGFQHLKLKKDLSLLLFDFTNPMGNNRLLPAGRLRETPQNSGKRADAIILTRCSGKKDSPHDIDTVVNFYPGCPVFRTFHRLYIHRWIKNDRDLEKEGPDMNSLKGKNALLFSGLANNHAFLDSMAGFNMNILHHLEFRDHHRYKPSDFLIINRMAKEKKADVILTTEKDWVKIDPGIKWGLDFLVIGIRIEFEHPESFQDFLVSRMGK